MIKFKIWAFSCFGIAYSSCLLLNMIIAIAYCYCVLLKVIAIAYCYCVLLRVIAIAYCCCLLLRVIAIATV